jgi:hypothetical protein
VNEPRPPWTLTTETLPAIDDHFWDWVLWLTSKDRAGGRQELVREQLSLLHQNLLEPIGVAGPPDSVDEAVRMYVLARDEAERQLGVNVDRTLGDEVSRAL